MAEQEFQGAEKARFPMLLALGILMAVVVVVVAMVIEPEYGIPLLILLVICAIAAVGFRVLAGSNRSDADSSDNVPKQGADSERPLGDSAEAHDEINPHDIPKDAPERDRTEEVAGTDGTTRGPLP
jgi:hypothetical protein